MTNMMCAFVVNLNNHHHVPADLCNLRQLRSFYRRVASKSLMLMLILLILLLLLLILILMLVMMLIHFLPGGFGLLLPVHPYLPHLPTCLPILHRRYACSHLGMNT